jgi:hypothetical protein
VLIVLLKLISTTFSRLIMVLSFQGRSIAAILPAPLGPKNPNISPSSTSKLIWSTASVFHISLSDFEPK